MNIVNIKNTVVEISLIKCPHHLYIFKGKYTILFCLNSTMNYPYVISQVLKWNKRYTILKHQSIL